MPARAQGMRRRGLLTAVLLAPGLCVLALGAYQALGPGGRAEVPCWLLPHLQVVEMPATLACPLERGDRIERVERGGQWAPVRTAAQLRTALAETGSTLPVEVLRDGRSQTLRLPVERPSRLQRAVRLGAAATIFAVLVGLPLLLLWRSRSRAALPLTSFYAAMSTVAVTVMAAPQSDVANRIAMLSLVFAPAALGHLALCFPRTRPVARDVPQLTWLPYAVSAVLAPVGAFALERDPILWPPFMGVLMALTTGAWAIVMLSCRSAMREASSAIELARARLVLVGAAVLPLIPTIGFLPIASGPTAVLNFYLWSLPVTLPLPVGLAISRYNLFDLGADLRASVARAVYVGLSALSLTLVLTAALAIAGAPAAMANVSLLFLVSLAGMAALEPLRRRLPDFVEGAVTPRLNELRALRAELASELATLRHEDTVMQRTAETLRRGVNASAGTLWLHNEGLWRLAHLWGNAPPAARPLLDEAHRALEGRAQLHLAALDDAGQHAPGLTAAQVEVVTRIEGGGEPIGLLLLGPGPRRAPYSGVDLDFVSSVTATAGVALHNARLADDLMASQDQAAVGRVALGIAHDVGKELRWISTLAERLPKRLDDPERLERDAELLVELSEDVHAIFRRFHERAVGNEEQAHESPPPPPPPLDQLVERAVRRAEQEHQAACVHSLIEPGARTLPFHPALGRALFNLLDNAVHASPADELVQLSAGRDGEGWVRIDIEDRGAGIPAHNRSQVFTPGFSTRKDRGGTGIGLTVARDIAMALGGSLELQEATPRGTRARLRIPTPSQEEPRR